MPPDYLRCLVPVENACRRVPERDTAARQHSDDRIVRRADKGKKE